jgi:hypothetical protein
MNNLLSSLKKVCQNNPLREKILIVPDYRSGHELCEALARDGRGWVNLRTETVTGLAHQVTGDYLAEKNITLLTSFLATIVIEEVFQELEGQKALQYFFRQGNSPGLVRAIASSIFELRSCGVTSDSLSADSFVSSKKGHDMLTLLKAYETYLERRYYIDSPGLLSLALQLISSAKTVNDAVYVLSSFLRLYPLELQLIKSIAGERLIKLKADPVYGIARPGAEYPKIRCRTPENKPVSDIERLPWIYQVEVSPSPLEDGTLSYFHAYGPRNEAREIFRRLQAAGIPLDTATVAYTSSEYISIFYTLARRIGVGVTFNEGIPGFLTGPGKVLQGLVDWIRKNFVASELRELFLVGDVQLPMDNDNDISLTPATAARLLRSSGAGWGRDRYVLLKDLALRLKERARMETDEEAVNDRRGRLIRESRQAEYLYEIIQTLLSSLPIPEADGRISFRDLTRGLSDTLAKLARVKDEMDAAALKGLVTDLIQAGQVASFKLEMNEALERVENILHAFRVGASGPRPGHLHLVGYKNLIWSGRPNTYVAGLDANSFPGSFRQDPVLLDTERRRIHPGLPLGIDRPRENQYTLAMALASRRGLVTLSFSSFDIVENRTVYPSSILLQAHRLLKGDALLDYTDLLNSLGKPAGYCPGDGQTALDEVEWWAWKVLRGRGIRNGAAAVRACYQGIETGSLALEARNSPEATEYDGLVDVNPCELDPRRKKDLVISCNMIEYLAGCPFAYFLRHVLQIHPPEELEYDTERWLDPLERGSLSHKLFCNFMKKVAAGNQRPSMQEHSSMMMEMAVELIEDYRKRVPPPSEIVYENEVRDIRLCCEIFLAGEEVYAGGTPVLFEVPFGLGSEDVRKSGCGLAGPVQVELGDGTSFSLRGKIDRIDRTGPGVYHVWDYKTGSAYGYEDHQYLTGGRQVQHALYAIAAEHILREIYPGERPRAEVSGYYFPTERGEGRRVARSQAKQDTISMALKHLFDILSSGAFIAASDGEKCGFCDYPDVCDSVSAVARASWLLKSGVSCLEPWRRLKKIE